MTEARERIKFHNDHSEAILFSNDAMISLILFLWYEQQVNT